MAILGLDLGGTKIAVAAFSSTGVILFHEVALLENRTGDAVGALISELVEKYIEAYTIDSIGIAVPGISRQDAGTIWAPNIPGWDDYPLLQRVKKIAEHRPVWIDSDRACCIFGEQWQGNAKDCNDVIFITVGTGIGAGILTNGNFLRGSEDIAGAIGWMALRKPFESKYTPCGCLEYYASGKGIARLAIEMLQLNSEASVLRDVRSDQLTAYHVFEALEKGDAISSMVLEECITYWGMAAANLVSIFNPEKVIFGGGIFGPASRFIDDIKNEASKWAQPVSISKVSFEKSALGSNVAVYGAAFLAKKNSGM